MMVFLFGKKDWKTALWQGKLVHLDIKYVLNITQTSHLISKKNRFQKVKISCNKKPSSISQKTRWLMQTYIKIIKLYKREICNHITCIIYSISQTAAWLFLHMKTNTYIPAGSKGRAEATPHEI